ncbi:MAG: DUF4430 domain-containing protein [Dehalococcoidia bacterium]|nr:DUF4430 domain-containing protein [Dehalococcoidia bacterium]
MRIGLIFALLLISLLPAGCGVQSQQGEGSDITARAVITKDFGKELILDETVTLKKDATVRDLLISVADVELTYGGRFIEAIEDISSKAPVKEDWLYYVNGVSFNKGIAETRIFDGDVVSFDFQDWRFRTFTPALAGYFPEPFLHGVEGALRPALIVYESSFIDEARALEDRLKAAGVKEVSAVSAEHLDDSLLRYPHVIVVGTSSNRLVVEMNGVWDRLGFFARFEAGGLTVYDAQGRVAAEYHSDAGVIQATQNPWNPRGIGVCENVAWMVSGTDENGVRAAAQALIENPAGFERAFGAVVYGGEIISIP